MRKGRWTRTAGRLLLAVTLTALPATALAYGDGTPDTDPPAEEEVCNGLGGRVWGLCVAYCEAQDCPRRSTRRATCCVTSCSI